MKYTPQRMASSNLVFLSVDAKKCIFEDLILFFNIILKEWSLRLSCAHSANGRSTPEEESDTSQKMVDLSCISAREQEISVLESLRLKDLDGLLHGEDFIKSQNNPIRARTRRRNSLESREPLKELPLMTLKRQKLLVLKIKKPLLRKQSVRSNKEREPKLPRKILIRRLSIRIRTSNKKLKIRLLKKLKRKLHLSKIRNDASPYLNNLDNLDKFDYFCYFKQGSYQNLSSCGLLPLVRVNLVPRYPLSCSTFLMFSSNFASTAFCAAFSSSLNLFYEAFPSSTCFNLCSDACLSSFLVNLLLFLKNESSMLTFTPSRATELDVESTQAGLTLPRGTPLTEQGPVIRRFPEGRLLRTTTLLPLCGPESKITMDPA